MKRRWPTARTFLRKMRGTPGCWVYPGRVDRNGYAFYKEGGLNTRAHRACFVAAKGATRGLYVLHRCHTPACCRPSHLHLGTARDNYEDARRADRHTRGERTGTSKLNAAQVLAIRADSRRQIDIAADFGVRQTTVSEIKRGNRWAHLSQKNT